MAPKRKVTTPEKGKGKVGEGSNRRRRAEEPTSDGVIPWFLILEVQESYVDKWKGKNYHQERMVQQADFHGHLLEHVIQQCGWSKVDAVPHLAYITLVREFFANFNKEIDAPESSHRHKTWVRGKWIHFSPVIIDRYYELNRTRTDPMPTEEDIQSVARFLYGRENAWPLATSHFKHDELTREIRALHIFVCTNINPTTQCTRFIGERARLLYHLARGRKMDLGTHIFDFVRELATSIDSNSQRSIMFPCLISGMCLEAGVPLLPFEKADTPEVLLTHKTIDNSHARMRAREIRARRAPAVQLDKAAHDRAPPVPQPALAVDTNLGIQFIQIQVSLTEIGRSVSDMQNTLVGVQHTQNTIQQELLRVSMFVRGWQHDGIDIWSTQRTINYAYDDVNRRMVHLESRI
ncbi:Envelope-like protein [Abeliophyllum distichum]|uniref:Envelope-like protein n=1 Tax=Abeliophyllum distichum TaxID=126358 RepID=A0ABD1RWC3_9LAMI